MKTYVLFIGLISQILFTQNKTHDVFFETDKYNITRSEEEKLNKFFSSLDTENIKSISIFGFCDDRGSHAYNMILSQNRADAIKNYFVSKNIDSHKISTSSGKGEIALKTYDKRKIPSLRSKNRRVNINIAFQGDESSLKTNEKLKQGNKIVVIKGPPYENIERLNEDFQVGDKIRFENLYFEIGYSFLIPDSKKELEKIADILAKRDNIFFTIEGHVCCTSDTKDAIDRSTKKRNLSIARAKYVYDFLLKKGVKKYRMKYVGMERKYPLGGDPKYDRRVEFLITYVGKN